MNSLQLKMVNPFTSGVELSEVTTGSEFRLRAYQSGDDDQWLHFINETGEFGKWDQEKLRNDILQYLVPGGGLFAIGKTGIVGCAAACRLRGYLPYATLMYVAVDPNTRGKGLGKSLTSAALRASQLAGYRGMVLNTDDSRIPAIRTYIATGFVPHLVSEFDHAERWKTVFSKIKKASTADSLYGGEIGGEEA